MSPQLVEVGDRCVFGLEVPWLPVVEGDQQQGAFGRQVAMVRALAEGVDDPAGALQLRIVVSEDERQGRSVRRLRVFLLGASSDPMSAGVLHDRVRATLPPDYVVEPVGPGTVADLLDAADSVPWSADRVAEIRRALESSDAEVDGPEPVEPVLLRWEWTPVNLVASLGALYQLPVGAQLIVHLEARAVSPQALGWLRSEIARLVALYRDDEGGNPLLVAVVNGYRRWLRDLPRASVHVRVVLVSPTASLPAGVPEVVGADLTRSWETGSPVGTFDVLRPRNDEELDIVLALVQMLRSRTVREPVDRQLAELMHLFDPHEASAAFRLPLPGPEGLPGLRAEPVSTLPGGLASSVRNGGHGVLIGTGPSGDSLVLGDEELNRHVLVAGLPGFGKTTTVTAMLRQLWTDPVRIDSGRQVPFLVIDPAKRDYEGLAEELGADCRLVELGTEAVALNPFAAPPGVPRGVFATRVAAAFDAAYDLSVTYPAAGVLLTRAVHRVMQEPNPSMQRLYATVLDLIANSDYEARTKGDLRGALVGRLELLCDGSLGTALMGGPGAAVDWADVLSRPAVLLTRQFTGQRERALLMSLLLAGLVSYREYHPTAEGLGHVTVIEEAHRMLAAHPGGIVNDGAQVFVDAMAELRGAGEGIVVVEQAPSRLVPEVRKLVGTTIAHRTVDADERATLAAALTLPAEDRELARLPNGSAIVLSAAMSAPAVVRVQQGEGGRLDGTPERSSTLVPERVSAVHALWCQECPVACRGLRGATAAADVHRTHPTLDWRGVADQASEGLSLAEKYCCEAFCAVQGPAPAREKRMRQRKAKAAYQSAARGTAGSSA